MEFSHIDGLADEDLEIDGEDLVISESYVATGMDDIEPTPAPEDARKDGFVPPKFQLKKEPIADDLQSVFSDGDEIDEFLEETVDGELKYPPDTKRLTNREAFDALK